MTRARDEIERLEQQYQRLRTRNPVCIHCGECNPFCLELHHIAGRKHHSDLSIVCRNCHRKLSEKQRYHGANGSNSGGSDGSPPNAAVGRYLLGFSDLLEGTIPTLRAFGEQLLEGDSDDDDDSK